MFPCFIFSLKKPKKKTMFEENAIEVIMKWISLNNMMEKK